MILFAVFLFSTGHVSLVWHLQYVIQLEWSSVLLSEVFFERHFVIVWSYYRAKGLKFACISVTPLTVNTKRNDTYLLYV